MCVSYLFKFVRFVEIRHLSTRQYVVDILKKGLLNDLRVGEQKDCGLVIDTRLVVQLSDICQESDFLWLCSIQCAPYILLEFSFLPMS